MGKIIVCKDCANATLLGFCVAFHKWTVLDIPRKCEFFIPRKREGK